jgi:hypothetical protein
MPFVLTVVLKVPQHNTTGAADPFETTSDYAAVLQGSTKYMPRGVAEGMQCNARRVMMTAAPTVLKKLEALPTELMDQMGKMSVPDRIELSSPDNLLVPGKIPSFMTSLVRLLNSKVRLRYIQTMLRNSVLEIASLRELDMLKAWLASIKFDSLDQNLRDGFAVVRALSFSDINRSAASISGQTWPAPSTWADDLELTQMCKDLRYLEVDASLSDRVLWAIENADSMEKAMTIMEEMKEEGEDDSETYQLTRFLELEGLKVLRLRFFTERWNMTTLDGEKMHMVSSWLEKEFATREQSVEVKFFAWFE